MKKIVRPFLAGAGVTGALAAANRALSNAPVPTNALGGTRRPWSWHGSEIFATEAGSGPPVLLVHGIYAGASSYEFRKLFPLLARRHRVVAFDLIGCGLSDKPKLSYNAELFVEQIVDAVEAFTDEPVGIVASSLGAAFAIRAATRGRDTVARLATICPTGLAGALDRGPTGPGAAITALVRTPLLGEAAFNALASRPSIRWFLEKQVYGDPAHVTPEIVDHYYAVTHQRGSRYVPAAFVGGALDCDVARDLPFLSIPLAVLWGDKAPSTAPRANADEFLRLARDARLLTFANSGLLPHEEEPDAVADALATFLNAAELHARG
ncbi:MAG: alpha/beta fold hydrolase [Candidatus Eremiobacteraeota bacterium]|nr:alpha/beta fold hydrolase [Candidatus Eremiobacteraeota bacterium]